MIDDLERQFNAAMTDACRRAKSEVGCEAPCHHEPTVEAARSVLRAPTASDEFAALAERERLDLTVEALVHDHPEFQPLFTDEELAAARSRLVEAQYPPAIDPLEPFIGAFASDVPDWTSRIDYYLGRELMDDHQPKPGSGG